MSDHVHTASCKWCALDLEFEMPDELVRAYRRDKLVIFAGAGISTEVPTVLSESLYQRARALAETDADSFPRVIQAFQDKFDRATLVKEIRSRFSYADSFPSARRASRQFHAELATLPQIRDIITTNWDTYFEEECLATPFVVGEDIAYHDLYERRVYKLHGSITNLATLVATEEDYSESLVKLGTNVLGSHVRNILATKTVVFVGYSLTDWNFRRLYDALRADMGKFTPRAFVVSPFDAPEADALGLVHIRTSGVNFVRELKRSLQDDCILPDDIYELIARIQKRAERADEIAKNINSQQYPAVVYTWFYSDAVLDACFRILQRRGSGEYSDAHRVQWLARKYAAAAERAAARGNYGDAAYLEGYTNVLIALLVPWLALEDSRGETAPTQEPPIERADSQRAEESDDPDEYDEYYESFPHFFLPGIETDLTGPDEFQAGLEESRRKAPRQRMRAREIVATLPPGMVLEHTRDLPDLFQSE
jgi:NAD-dependent SIR2 family protein deacetylase